MRALMFMLPGAAALVACMASIARAGSMDRATPEKRPTPTVPLREPLTPERVAPFARIQTCAPLTDPRTSSGT
jgi:hypothetical protein